ncbi:MAG: hypothetical protein RL701_3815, partial [Pseudomonadota bacterium]
MESTADGGDEWLREHAESAPVAGLVVLMQAGEGGATTSTVAITRAAAGVKIGRGSPHGLLSEDGQVSREHVQISLGGSAEAPTFRIRDLGSRNGTFVDGVRLEGETER